MKFEKIKITAKGTVAAVAFIALVLLAQQGVSAEPALKATPDHYEFGTLAEGDPATITVEVENTGTAPVEITNVQTSWSCTEAVLVQHTLNAGEKTKLTVTYKTKGLPGDFEKKVFFTTNLPDQEKFEVVSIKGHVAEAPSAKISVNPRTLVIEGSDRDAGKKQEYAIANDGTLPLEVTRIFSKNDGTAYFDGAANGNLVIDPGQTKTVEIQLGPAPGADAVQKMIVIESNARTPNFILVVRYK